MARIRKLIADNDPARSPRTEVDCIYGITYTADGTKLLRLATLGSEMRKSTPKPSQIMEIDANIAQQLIEVIRSTFPSVRTP